MSESPTTQAVLRKAQPQIVIVTDTAEAERRRAFGLAVYSGLIQIAAAFYRYFVGGEPPCLRK